MNTRGSCCCARWWAASASSRCWRESSCRASASEDSRDFLLDRTCRPSGAQTTRNPKPPPCRRAGQKGETAMPETTEAPYGHKTQKEPAVKEVHVLWTP